MGPKTRGFGAGTGAASPDKGSGPEGEEEKSPRPRSKMSLPARFDGTDFKYPVTTFFFQLILYFRTVARGMLPQLLCGPGSVCVACCLPLASMLTTAALCVLLPPHVHRPMQVGYGGLKPGIDPISPGPDGKAGE